VIEFLPQAGLQNLRQTTTKGENRCPVGARASLALQFARLLSQLSVKLAISTIAALAAGVFMVSAASSASQAFSSQNSTLRIGMLRIYPCALPADVIVQIGRYRMPVQPRL
jgi:hypothetical protein